MPSKKKKYNARFPAGRIKKIMQSDEEIGKVAQAVPVIISRTLELFVESLLTKTLKITNSRNAKTLSTSHMKQCIMMEQRFDFLRELVKNIPDISVAEEAANYNEEDTQSSPEENYPDSDTPFDLSMPSTSTLSSLQSKRSVPTNARDSNKRCANTDSNACSQIEERTRMHLKRSSEVLQRLQKCVQNDSANNAGKHPVETLRRSTSVISINTECTPPKLMRSESATGESSPLTCEAQRIKQPINTNQQKELTTSPLLHHPHTQTQTSIPAPIVRFDFCNKPVVKIDYSNLSVPTADSETSFFETNDSTAAASRNTSEVSYSAAPIINIDLTNMIANTATTSTTPQLAANGAVSLPIISIKTVETTPTPAAASKPTPTATIVAATGPATPNASISDAGTSVTSALNYSSNMKTGGTGSAEVKKAVFELDEDYDNI